MSAATIELVRATVHAAHGATAGWETALAVAVASFLFLAVLAIAVFGIIRQTGHPGDDDADSGPGGGPGRWRPDRPRGPEGSPDWWPEFERQFAAYVSRRGTEAAPRLGAQTDGGAGRRP